MLYKVGGGQGNLSKFNIKKGNHFKHLWISLYYIFVLISGGFLISYIRYGYFDYSAIINILGIVGFILLIPQFILHINYYQVNKKDTIIYDEVKNSLVIESKGKSNFILLDDILLIESFKSYPSAEKRFHWFPWDHYSFIILHTKCGKMFLITSLLLSNADIINTNRKINFQLNKVFYPYASVKFSRTEKDEEKFIPSTFIKKVKLKSDKELRLLVNTKNSGYDERFVKAAVEELKLREEKG